MANRICLHRPWVRLKAVLMAVCLLGAGLTLHAQAADKPVRSARLSYLQGNVTVDHIDNTGSDPAQLNMPLAQGVRVTTGKDGQAEIEFEDGSLVRLAPNSSLDLTSMTADGEENFKTELTLDDGLAYAELQASPKFAYSIDAGGATVSPVKDTTVRIDMDTPPAVIAVLDGTAQVERVGSTGAGGYRTDVTSGHTLTDNTSNAEHYAITKKVAENSWDQWNDDRDQEAAKEAANQTEVRDQYAGNEGYGWTDLDANGSWYDVPGEGQVWQPYVAMSPGFDPYGFGSWTWYPGMGYVWASGYQWGWTPYRCGNWSYWNGFGWGWLPGRGCGFSGWGFGRGGYGGGYGVNIVRPPAGYHFRPMPVHSPGQVHPIKVGHPVASPVVRPPQGPRKIGGHTVQPLRPIPTAGAGTSVRPGQGTPRRDFPVNSGSHRPLQKRTTPLPGQPPVAHPVNPGAGSQRREQQARPMQPMRPVQPSVPRQGYPQQEQRRPSMQQPQQRQQPQPRYTPQPQQRSMPRAQPSGPPARPMSHAAPAAPSPRK